MTSAATAQKFSGIPLGTQNGAYRRAAVCMYELSWVRLGEYQCAYMSTARSLRELNCSTCKSSAGPLCELCCVPAVEHQCAYMSTARSLQELSCCTCKSSAGAAAGVQLDACRRAAVCLHELRWDIYVSSAVFLL
ncbi:hypothetical protein NDU88_008665 [Pleurodeles waltl]|uniref:Uncharacterized protein n=1 Tax=Pleurodeles waltl TaxID=8319 RepID=A0AAV7P5Q0_PLEWA|nr:hypothetical protein NDU88_008665 [Pleurodeles waltl]